MPLRRKKEKLVIKNLGDKDKLIQEFDLINPFARDPAWGGERDKDFEPKDPGWEYPDPPKVSRLIDPVDVITRQNDIKMNT